MGYPLSPNLRPGTGFALLPPTHLGHKNRSWRFRKGGFCPFLSDAVNVFILPPPQISSRSKHFPIKGGGVFAPPGLWVSHHYLPTVVQMVADNLKGGSSSSCSQCGQVGSWALRWFQKACILVGVGAIYALGWLSTVVRRHPGTQPRHTLAGYKRLSSQY